MLDADKLTAQVKRKLNITWSDETTNARLADIIDTARRVMAYKIGVKEADAGEYDG